MTAGLLILASLLGQGPGASLHGTVRDTETGTPVRGAAVELLDATARSPTNEAGRYLLTAVPIGPRHLRVSGLGYQPRMLHVFVPAEGAVRVDVALVPNPIPVPGVEASLERTRAAPFSRAGTDRVERVGSRTVTLEELRADPGLPEPDVFEALGGGSVLVDPESPNGLHVRGGSGDQNLFLLDGIPIFSPYHATGQFSAIGPDAISRVDLHAAVPPAGSGDALSGVVDLRTKRPGSDRVRSSGALTATGARATADGPAPLGARFLVSGGLGYPGFLVPSSEQSYLHGSFTHGLAKLKWPVASGLLQALGFRSDNTLRMIRYPTGTEDAGTRPTGSEPAGPVAPGSANRFAWHGSSYGVSWEKAIGTRSLIDAGLWYADLYGTADWLAPDSSLTAFSRRRSSGYRVRLSVDGDATRSVVGLSLERERTAYDVRRIGSPAADGAGTPLDLSAQPTVFAAFAEHQAVLEERIGLALGLRGIAVSGHGARLAPRLSVHGAIAPSVSASAGYARTYQWAQSLRNTESLIDNLFTPDLPIHIGADGVPVAHADQLTVALAVRPTLGIRLGVEVFARELAGVVLVAPTTGQPFAVDGFAVGRTEARGLGVDLEIERARYRASVRYGAASVDTETPNVDYRPAFATTHSVSAGAAYYPTPQLEVRSGLRVEVGRPTTSMEGPFVWEACSILEGGCEAEGSPQRAAGTLGGERLPPYVRLDIGVRRHWHSRILEREGTIAAFATLSNVLGRRNVLGYVSDPTTGAVSGLPMRPFSPLAVGVEWRF